MTRRGPRHHGEERQPRRRHPWRTNIEAATLALVVAVLFKYFIVEAYRIPTGSMQPTLMGWSDGEGGGVFDRVLVDKLSYHYRDPERFDVVVFRFPLDRSRNFVKRIVGMPGEHLRIRGGDLYLSSNDGASWEILRKPRAVQRELLLRLETDGAWAFGDSPDTWSHIPGGIDARGPGRAVFPATLAGIRDGYADGYPPPLARAIRARGIHGGENPVSDLRIESVVTADADCTEVALELHDATAQYRYVIPGPAAEPGAVARIVFRMHDGLILGEILAEKPARLQAGSRVHVAAQNIDNLLELEVDGEVVCAREGLRGSPHGSRAVLTTTGAGARFDELQVLRDVYYTPDERDETAWRIPADAYVVLGDNTQNSADSREWTSTRLEFSMAGGGRRHVRGELRPDENPRIRRVADGGENELLGCFRDEFGELHWFHGRDASDHGAEAAPFVPRSAITGRALLVFWPIRPSLGVRAPRWIH